MLRFPFNSPDQSEVIEEFVIFAVVGNTRNTYSEKMLGKLTVQQEEYSGFVDVIRTRNDKSTKEYRFDASRRGAKLKEVNIREILLEISRETNGRVQILGANYIYNQILARSHKREVRVIKSKVNYNIEDSNTQSNEQT